MIEVSVTYTDIQTGEKFSLTNCPLGKAIRRARPKAEITVGYGFVGVVEDGESKLYMIPKKVETYIREFEKGKYVKPYITTLEEVPKRANAGSNGD